LPMGCDAGVATLLLGGMMSLKFSIGVTSYSAPNNHLTTQVTERYSQGHIYC